MTKLRITYFDGTDEVLDAGAGYMGLGDRIAFERRFNVPAMEFAAMVDKLREAVAEDGESFREGIDPSSLGIREDWLAYFGWRVWMRDHTEQEHRDYDAWVDGVSDLTVEDLPAPEDEAPNPTDAPAALPSGSSPSSS